MTFEERVQQASPYLLCWIDLAMTPKKLSALYDLKRIKRLADKDFPVPHSDYTAKKLAPIQDFLQSRTGSWELLGEMTALQVLDFPKRTPKGIVDDFSFLPKLTNLRQLSLAYTSFSDCSLLAGLTNLKRLYLPARSGLSHQEILDTLPCQIKTNEPFWKDRHAARYDVTPTREVPEAPDTIALRVLEYVRQSPPGAAHPLTRLEFSGPQITRRVLDDLLGLVREGQMSSIYMEREGADGAEFFSVDLEGGWSAPVLNNAWDEGDGRITFQPFDAKYFLDKDEADAPVHIGGQTPIPKWFALDSLEQTLQCIDWFARTGQLYPGIHWARFH